MDSRGRPVPGRRVGGVVYRPLLLGASAIGERYERSMISHVETGRATLHFDALVEVAQALDV